MKHVELSFLKKSRILQAVHRVSSKTREEVYLVGGAVRDLLLGKPLGKDFDFVTAEGVPGLAKAVAQELGGHAFALDESFGTWRVVLKKGRKKAELDFSPMQGKDIFEDLKQRDFTINSIALSLEEILDRGNPGLIDPLGAAPDISRKILRANSEESLRQDPLRMLRAFRLASVLDLSVEEGTRAMIQRNKARILSSAGERIRNEFFAGLHEHNAGSFLRELTESGLLGEIFPGTRGWDTLYPDPPGPSLLHHALSTVAAGEFILARLEEFFPSLGRLLDQHFSEMIEDGVSRRALFKFVAFFHDSGKPGTAPRFLDHDQQGEKVNIEIARRMKLSRRTVRAVSGLTRHHMRLHSLRRVNEVTPRAKYRLFHDLGKEGVDLVLLRLSTALSRYSPEFKGALRSEVPGDFPQALELARDLLGYYYGEFTGGAGSPLLDGKEIMAALGLPQGEAVGALLMKLREAEITGRVRTREEALDFLKNIDRSA